MDPTVYCPRCRAPIGVLRDEGTEAVCPSCRYRYAFCQGTVTRFEARPVGAALPNRDRTVIQSFEYTLQVLASGAGQAFEFAVRGAVQTVYLQKGDTVEVCTVLGKGNRVEGTLVVSNLPGERYQLSTPGARARTVGLWGSGAGATGGMVLLLATGGFTALGTLAWPAWALFAGLGAALGHSIVDSRVRLAPAERNRLLSERQLYTERLAALAKVEHWRGQSAVEAEEIRRLSRLRTKMLDLGSEQYRHRIEVLERALNVYREQLRLSEELQAGHLRLAREADVEIESSQAARRLPDLDAFTNLHLDKRRELDTLEERRQALKLSLDAEAEVRQLGR